MSYTSVLHYKFKTDSHVYTTDAENTWNNIRRHIEEKHGMIAKVVKGKLVKNSYIEGFHINLDGSLGDQIQDNEWMQRNTSILLIRKPISTKHNL